MLKHSPPRSAVLLGAALLAQGLAAANPSEDRAAGGGAPVPLGAPAGPPTIILEVDAIDLPRQLLRSSMTIALPRSEAGAGPGGARTAELYFSTWTPGNHTPSGPIENVVDLTFTDGNGRRAPWRRDPERTDRFLVEVPAGSSSLKASFSYIAGQPNPNSRSSDSYGRANFGGVNWNTVLLYPGGYGAQGAPAAQQITVAPSIALPAQWAYATALGAEPGAARGRFESLRALRPGDPVRWVSFAPTTLARLIDSPLIAGAHLKTFELPVTGAPPHVLAMVGAEERFAAPPEWLIEGIGAMCHQATSLFAPRGFPRDRYTFLIILDEQTRFGLEHGESTFVGMGPRSFIDAKRDEGKPGGGSGMLILAHEYFHAWCGKLRAPEGLVRPDLNTPAHTELLWVYEGLTSYYEDLLAVRSGLTTMDDFRRSARATAVVMQQQSGRLWRSVEDTALAARHLRPRGLYWFSLRQGQEYYGQGAAFWLEADAIIRRGTSGGRSLDDFTRAFFDVPARPVGDQATYTRADVIAALRAVYDGEDWDALVRARIEEPAPTLDMSDLLRLTGYRLVFTDSPDADQKDAEKAGDAQLATSLGMNVNKDGEISDLIPGSPADQAGLGFGMKLVAVDGWVYSADRLRRAVKESPQTGSIALMVAFGDRIESRTITYSGGPRYPRLERLDTEPDILEAIARPIGAPH